MDDAAYAVLKATVRDRCRDTDRLFERIAERHDTFAASGEGVDSMAYRLHNLYGAFEQLFQEIASSFENQIRPDHCHTDLLRRMRLEIDGIRPALVSDHAHELLDELRRFRHLFRHAYSADLDPGKVSDLARKALALRSLFQQDTERFLTRLAP